MSPVDETNLGDVDEPETKKSDMPNSYFYKYLENRLLFGLNYFESKASHIDINTRYQQFPRLKVERRNGFFKYFSLSLSHFRQVIFSKLIVKYQSLMLFLLGFLGFSLRFNG